MVGNFGVGFSAQEFGVGVYGLCWDEDSGFGVCSFRYLGGYVFSRGTHLFSNSSKPQYRGSKSQKCSRSCAWYL